jgi:hypothetical protein
MRNDSRFNSTKSQGDNTYLIGHVIRFEPPKGKYCGNMIRGRGLSGGKEGSKN